MSNGRYAGDVPTSPWRSAMTVPRALMLRRTPDGLRLIQQPIAELNKLREESPLKFTGGSFEEAAKWLGTQADLPAMLDVEMTFSGVTGKSLFTLSLHTGKDERTSLTFDPSRNKLIVDRTKPRHGIQQIVGSTS